jgi:hypothetical protein
LLYAAELALDEGDTNRARLLLQRIIDLPIDPEWEYENLRDKERAAKLSERLG